MGHKHSKSHHHHKDHHDHNEGNSTQEVDAAFYALSADKEAVTLKDLQNKFGENLALALWDFISQRESTSSLSREQFAENAQPVLDMSKTEFVNLLLPPERLLRACFEVNNIEEQVEDKGLVGSFIEEMSMRGKSAESIYAWINANCPRLCDHVINRVLSVFNVEERKATDYSSSLLTPVQMHILSNCVPVTIYYSPPLKKGQNGEIDKHWESLYSTKSQELSPTSFEANVFSYQGPTIAIFQLKGGDTFAIASNEQWKHSSTTFGGANSILIRLYPTFKRWDIDNALYCNFKLNTAAFGIMFGNELNIDYEMGNVEAIEVWGCAGIEPVPKEEEPKPRPRQDYAPPKKTKADAWDDNPDKQILEMQGKTFSNERRGRNKEQEHERERSP